MALDDLGGVLKELSIKVSFVPLAPEKEARARELVRELSTLFTEALAKQKAASR
jgi:hypothetical protein